MIYEICTYGITVGSLAEVEKRFGEAYESRKKYSELGAFWHTEIGPLNEIISVWPYQDLAERTKIQAEVSKDPNWPPKIDEFIRTMHSEVLMPFPSSPPLIPGKLGPIYEMRVYNMRSGTLSDTMQLWESKLPGRLELSPIVLLGNVDLGEVSRLINIWAYPSLEQRTAIRSKAVQLGVWPPRGGTIVAQANKILLPAAFSPLQ